MWNQLSFSRSVSNTFYIHTYIHIHTHTYIYIYIAFLGACQIHFMCLYTCIHTYVCIYTHTYIYTDIYKYKYIYSFSRSVSNIFHCKTSAQIDFLKLSKASARLVILSSFLYIDSFQGCHTCWNLFRNYVLVPSKVVPCVGCKRRKACP